MTIGEHIRELRLQRNLSQDELGELAQVNGRHISRYENGKVRPTAKVLRRFAKVLDVSLEDLMALTKGQTAISEAVPFRDGDLYQQFLEVDRLDEEDRFVAKRMLQALIMKKQLQDLLTQQPRLRASRSA